MNIQRLKNDQQKLRNFAARHHALLKVLDTTGAPPTSYRLAFTCKGYTNMEGDTSAYHEVVLSLPTNYPAEIPTAHFETPIFHPNVYTDGEVCLGFDSDTWKPSIPITTIVAKIGNMIRFSPNTCNLKSQARLLSRTSWQEWMDSHLIPIDEHLYMPDDEVLVKTRVSREPQKPTVTIRQKSTTGGSTQTSGRPSRQIRIRLKTEKEGGRGKA